MIQINNVTKRFGPLTAVDALSLSINQGELFSCLGPNGAGKTTTIKMLTGLMAPDEGSITLNGVDIQKEPVAAKRLVGYIPDVPFLYNKLTGEEFLTVVGNLYEMPGTEIQKQIIVYREQLDMEDWFEQQIEGYSRGMKQRVAFAAAMVHEPEILIIDEPMVGLDPRTGRRMKQLMRDKANNGTTIFLSTHNLNVAEELSDRIGIINRGKLLSLGTMAELRQDSNESLEELFIQLVDESAEDTLAKKPV